MEPVVERLGTGFTDALRVDPRGAVPKAFSPKLRERLRDVARPEKVLVGFFTMAGTDLPVEFTTCLIELEKPRHYVIVHQPSRTQADGREGLCQAAIEGGYTYAFLMDIDMVYPKDMLVDLLREDVEVVCGFALSRHTPHFPTFGPRGQRFGYVPSWPTDDGHRSGRLDVGLRRTAIVGGAGMLLRVDALLRMPRPWFCFPGEGERGLAIGEDVYFTQRCEDAGIETWCATNQHVAHQVKCWILPRWHAVEGESVENGRLGRWDMNVEGLSNLYDGPAIGSMPRAALGAAFGSEDWIDPDPAQVSRPPVQIGEAE